MTKDYDFMPIDDASKILTGEKPVVDNFAVMSFDDGYLDKFIRVLPIIREHGIPDAIYCATGAVEHREAFWFDRQAYVLFDNDAEWAAVISVEELSNYAADGLVTIGGNTVSHRRLSYSTEAEIAVELTKFHGKIKHWTRRPCLYFSYPNGAYDDVSKRLVKALG